MKNLQENIVPAENQNKKDYFAYGENNSSGKNILFVGNSITKHAPKPEMGWTNDCGMAASTLEKDYVHILMNKINEKCPDSKFSILQVAGFETDFTNRDLDTYYNDVKEFKADIIIMFFGANVDKSYDLLENPPKTFGSAYEDLRNYLDNEKQPIFLHSQGFYIRPVLDLEKQAVAEKYGDIFINIEDIRTREDAHGLFNHPGDLGMQLIAERFWEYIENLLL